MSNIVYKKTDNADYFSLISAQWNSSYHNLNKCFLVLIDYFEHIDSHYATNAFSSITISINDEDYKIAYVDGSTVELCKLNLEADNCQYILVLEDEKLINTFCEENVYCIALITNKYNLEYFTKEGS